MFQEHIQEVICQVDPNKTLIYHGDLVKKVALLTLVKKRKNAFFSPDYEVMNITLGDLIPVFAGFSEFTETTIIKDYQYSGQSLVRTGIQGGVDMASAGVKAGAHSHQEASSVTIKAKTLDILKLKEQYCGQKINTDLMPKLSKGEVLAFVDKIVFSTDDVTLHGKTGVDGSCEASWKVMMTFSLMGKRKKETSFTVPAGHVYAYSLNEIKFKDEEIEITTRSNIEYIGDKVEEQQLITAHPIQTSAETALAPETFEPDNCTEKTFETLQQVQEEILRTEVLLQPLAHLPRVTRLTLFQRLSLLSEDRHALTLLKLTLDQWREGERFEQPQSWSVRSVLHLLRDVAPAHIESGIIYMDLEAVYLLVSAMDKLPDCVPSLIAKCHPDTLRGLNQLVSSLKQHGQAHLSESLPAPLQDGGELHWLAVFLCSSNDSLRELFELRIVAGDKPGVLLVALCAAVQGLNMML